MTRDDAKEIIFMLMAAYPNWHPMDLRLTVNVWASTLEPYELELAKQATSAYIAMDTKGFAPSPGQLVALIHTADDYAYPAEMEAWAMVRKAIGDGNYHSKERFGELPEIVQRAVGSSGQIAQWAITDIESVETVVQSNFLRSYRAIVERDKSYRKLPQGMKAIVDKEVMEGRRIEEKKAQNVIPKIDRETRTPDPGSQYKQLVDRILKKEMA